MPHENLWAPWRMAYISQLDVDPSKASTPPACFLCEAAASEAGGDEQRRRLILLNDHRGQVLLNRYPYTNGHLLVAPGEHLADLCDLTAASRGDLIELVNLAELVLRAVFNPQGINIGINLGRCAGAGLPGHLHVHVVPRWSGDTNFMQTVGQVRVIPDALEASYEQLAVGLAKINAS